VDALVLVVLVEEVERFFAFVTFFSVVACTDEAAVAVIGAALKLVVLDVPAVLWGGLLAPHPVTIGARRTARARASARRVVRLGAHLSSEGTDRKGDIRLLFGTRGANPNDDPGLRHARRKVSR
jgi:hypothetical protein